MQYGFWEERGSFKISITTGFFNQICSCCFEVDQGREDRRQGWRLS